LRDHHLARFRKRLKSGSDIRRLTDDALLLCSAFADEIADNDQPRGYADPHL
jgi:hypothetical protein